MYVYPIVCCCGSPIRLEYSEFQYTCNRGVIGKVIFLTDRPTFLRDVVSVQAKVLCGILGVWGRLDQGKHMIITFLMPSISVTPADDGIMQMRTLNK